MRPTLSPWAPHAPRIRHPYLGKYEPSPAVPIGDVAPFITGLFGPGASLALQAGANAAPLNAPAADSEALSYAKTTYGATVDAARARFGANNVSWQSLTDDRWGVVIRVNGRADYDRVRSMLPSDDYLAKWPSGLPENSTDYPARPVNAYSIPKRFEYKGYTYGLDNPSNGISIVHLGGAQFSAAGTAEALNTGAKVVGGSLKATADAIYPVWWQDAVRAAKWASLGGAVLITVVVASFLLPKG